MSELWNIRGVSEESRRKAKGAAGAAGMTLGKWLEMAIAEAAERGPGRFEIVGVKEAEGILEAPEGEILIPPGPDIEPRKREKVHKHVRGTFVNSQPVVEYRNDLAEEMSKETVEPAEPEVHRCQHGNSTGHYCMKCGHTIE